jgi:hypothetical protein
MLNYLANAIPLSVCARELDSSFSIGDGSINVGNSAQAPAAFVFRTLFQGGARLLQVRERLVHERLIRSRGGEVEG